MTPPETPRTDAAKYIGRQSVPSHLAEDMEREAAALKREIADAKEQARLGWERHAEKDAAYQQALNERDQWREVAGRLEKELRYWVPNYLFKMNPPDESVSALQAYDALAKRSEKFRCASCGSDFNAEQSAAIRGDGHCPDCGKTLSALRQIRDQFSPHIGEYGEDVAQDPECFCARCIAVRALSLSEKP